MTQPILFALEDGEHSPVTQGTTVDLANNVKGDFSEFEFCKQATLRGWKARHIGGKEANYDVIISRENARSLFVQVKWVKLADCGNGNCYYKIPLKAGRRLYSPFAFDVLAAHLHDIDKWVFYTRQEIGNRQGTWYVLPEQRKNAVAPTAPDIRNPDNWSLLDNVAQSLIAT